MCATIGRLPKAVGGQRPFTRSSPLPSSTISIRKLGSPTCLPAYRIFRQAHPRTLAVALAVSAASLLKLPEQQPADQNKLFRGLRRMRTSPAVADTQSGISFQFEAAAKLLTRGEAGCGAHRRSCGGGPAPRREAPSPSLNFAMARAAKLTYTSCQESGKYNGASASVGGGTRGAADGGDAIWGSRPSAGPCAPRPAS